MSEGPIKQWRDAHLPKRSVPQSQAVHLFDVRNARAVCGRKVPMSKIALPPKGIATCADCLAAATADTTEREYRSLQAVPAGGDPSFGQKITIRDPRTPDPKEEP